MPDKDERPQIEKRWKVVFSADADKALKKLDQPIKIRIFKFVEQKIINTDNPRKYGKRLVHPSEEVWSYRVGTYRLIAQFIDKEMIIDIIKVGHRKQIYKKDLVH